MSLAELKQSLLQKAFSGELTSSNVVAFTRPVSQQAVATTSPEFGAHVIAYGYHWHAAQSEIPDLRACQNPEVPASGREFGQCRYGATPEKCAAGPNDASICGKAEDWAKEQSVL